MIFLRSAFDWLGLGRGYQHAEQVVREELRGQRGPEHVLRKWMMGGLGTRLAMEYLEQIMNKRAGLVSRRNGGHPLLLMPPHSV